MSQAAQTTAFVFAGGGSLGAVQVGMLRELMHAGVSADLVVGSSVGAMNAAYFAGAPNAAGVDKLEKVWRGLRRHDVFPVTFRSVLGFMGGADNLIDPSNLRRLVEHNIPFPNLEDAPIPVHVVATNLGGATVCLSSGLLSRRSSPALRFQQLSHRFISAITISLMAQSRRSMSRSGNVWDNAAMESFFSSLTA
jgi:predicted acylesterase/phospholipase RssA